jgi:predicted NAD-dependent protein-ADP-ribosyltransferase YbiA (DUF1768 family)
LFLLPEDAAPSEFASRLVSAAIVFLVHGLSRPERNIVMILIRKVADDYGWLGNMSPYPLEWQNKAFRTTEALFQCLRFQDEFSIEEIRKQKSPMAAKMIAKRHKANMVVVPMGLKDLNNMNLVLGLKVEQHPVIEKQLIETGDEEILEDCSKRARGSGLFWGAALKDGQWQGENWLGKLWMKVRAEFSECN